MSSEQIGLVQSTFAEVQPNATVVADMFYTRLFTLDSFLRLLFKGDLAQQGHLLMVMLASAVSGLNHLDTLTPVLRQLGARHVNYAVCERHYTVVGSALLWTQDPEGDGTNRAGWTKFEGGHRQRGL